MKKKVLIYIFGIVLLLPVVLALCSTNLMFCAAMLVYGILLWNSPKFSPKIKTFWREFWKIQKSLEVRFEEYEN